MSCYIVIVVAIILWIRESSKWNHWPHVLAQTASQVEYQRPCSTWVGPHQLDHSGVPQYYQSHLPEDNQNDLTKYQFQHWIKPVNSEGSIGVMRRWEVGDWSARQPKGPDIIVRWFCILIHTDTGHWHWHWHWYYREPANGCHNPSEHPALAVSSNTFGFTRWHKLWNGVFVDK